MTTAEPRIEAEQLAAGLYPHQVEGLAFLLGRRRSILADDMGLGKTRQSILALTHAEPDGPWLVVCPASVKRNWQREIGLVLPDAATHIVGPTPPPAPGYRGWVIVNYDVLKRHFDALSEHPWRGLVFDEAHYLKNHTSVRSRLSTKLVTAVPGDPVVHALTGTPLTNRPRDLFPLLQLVDHALGRSFLGFAKRYCDATKNEHGHWVTSGASNVEELAVQLHGIMLRRHKDEVLDLPPKVRSWVDIDIPEKARDCLNEAVRAFLGSESEAPDRDHRGRRTGIGQLSGARRRLAAVKAKHTQEYVQGAVDQGEKVLVFSAFQNPITRFSRHFGDAAVTITGETPVPERQDLVDRFQEDDSVRVYIGQIHAGGTGVNLTAARQVVFNDLDWVPSNHWQAEDRAYRIGQTGSVHVTYMVAGGTIEEFVRNVLERKSRIVDDLVEGRSLGADLDADVLGELRRMLKRLDQRFVGLRTGAIDETELTQVLRAAGDEYLREQAAHLSDSTMQALVPVSEGAIQALAAVLGGPRREAYRVTSSRDATVHYTLEVVGADITCDCRGFHYRGACAHARALKQALVAGADAPAGYERLDGPTSRAFPRWPRSGPCRTLPARRLPMTPATPAVTSASRQRVADAFAFREPDRTPLFEIYSPFHPVYWDIAGRTPATDASLFWDARAEGITDEELFDLCVDAEYRVNRHFEVDMVRLNSPFGAGGTRPVKTGKHEWTLDGIPYRRDPRTDLVRLVDPAAEQSYSHRYEEAAVRNALEAWDGTCPPLDDTPDRYLARVQARAAADGIDWVYMAEIGAGTGVAFFPPFLLMWMLDEPELFGRWVDMQKAPGLERTRQAVAAGATVVAMGGDVSCDKGPFISPNLYREFILPVIQEHVQLIQSLGAQAVYTSDGNHWPIRDAFFFDSGIDGYKEVDKAAGMTWPRLIEEGVAGRVCIIGNIDARYTMCQGTPDDVRLEVRDCLDHGRSIPGGHILHLSHSVHEDIPVANYEALVATYRDYFGLAPLATQEIDR